MALGTNMMGSQDKVTLISSSTIHPSILVIVTLYNPGNCGLIILSLDINSESLSHLKRVKTLSESGFKYTSDRRGSALLGQIITDVSGKVLYPTGFFCTVIEADASQPPLPTVT